MNLKTRTKDGMIQSFFSYGMTSQSGHWNTFSEYVKKTYIALLGGIMWVDSINRIQLFVAEGKTEVPCMRRY